MATIDELQQAYVSLDHRLETRGESQIDAACLLSFNYDYPEPARPSFHRHRGVHRRLSLDRPPRLRHPHRHLHPQPQMHRTQVPQVLPALLPRCGHRPGTRRQPHPQRLSRRLPPPLHESGPRLQDPRRHPHLRQRPIFGASGLISNCAQMKMRLVCNNPHSVRPERSGEVNTASKRRSAEAVLTSPRSRRACPEFITGPISAVALSRSSCSYPDDRPWTIPAQAGT